MFDYQGLMSALYPTFSAKISGLVRPSGDRNTLHWNMAQGLAGGGGEGRVEWRMARNKFAASCIQVSFDTPVFCRRTPCLTNDGLLNIRMQVWLQLLLVCGSCSGAFLVCLLLLVMMI